jgi:hypothetical protein
MRALGAIAHGGGIDMDEHRAAHSAAVGTRRSPTGDKKP